MSLSNTERSGLSPLARGTLNIDRAVDKVIRFIPAGAGNTLVLNRPALETPVYPRWRGEHGFTSLNDFKFCGLSPLARGTLCYPLKTADSRRFIPAGAGNTRPASRLAPDIPVYPRWRGEHVGMGADRNMYIGLSPLARGTRSVYRNGPGRRRFIPAGAGNTRWQYA